MNFEGQYGSAEEAREAAATALKQKNKQKPQQSSPTRRYPTVTKRDVESARERLGELAASL